MERIVFIFLTVIFNSYFALSQSFSSYYRVIGKSNGLLSTCVYDVEFSKSGDKLFFATDKGVGVYDGSKVVSFTEKDGLPDSDIFLIKRDFSNRIWCAVSNYGICYIKDGKVFSRDNSSLLNELKIYGWVNSISESSDSTIWFGTFSGDVFILNKNGKFLRNISFKSSLGAISGVVNRLNSNIYVNKGYAIYYLSEVGFVKVLKSGKKNVIGLNRPYQKVFVYNEFTSFAIIKDSIFVLENFKQKFRFKLNLGFGEASFIKCFNNRLYIGDGKRILELSFDGKYQRKLIESNGVDKVFYKGDCFVVNSIKDGIFILNDGFDNKIDSTVGLVRSILSAGPVNGVWCGGDYGKLRLYSGRNVSEICIKGTSENTLGRVFDLKKLNKDLISISFERNFSIIDKNSKKLVRFPFGSKCYSKNSLFSLVGFSNNCFLVPNNLLETNFNNVTSYVSNLNPFEFGVLPGVRIFSSCSFGNNRFLVGANSGLWELQIGSRSVSKKIILGITVPIRYVDTLSATKICIFSDSRSLEILDLEHRKIQLNLGSELEKVRVQRIRTITPHILWLCSDNGLYLCSLSTDYKKYKLRRFSTRDGLLSDEVYDIAFASGKWWVATGKGLNQLGADFYKFRAEAAPNPTFSSFLLNGKAVNASGPVQDLVGSGKVNFSFGCLSLQHLGNLRFRYRLSPGSSWIYSEKFDHELNSLSVGDYRIEVQAASPNSPWSASLVFPAFSILAPFWERGWVILLSSALFFSMVVAVVYNVQRVRIARLRLESEMTDASLKSLRMQMKPHFLSNILNSMHYFILNESPEESGNYVSSFSRMVRHILDSADKNYLPLKSEMSRLTDYLSFECKRADREVHLEWIMQKDADFSRVLMPTMLLQPLLENSLMHGLFPLKDLESRVEIRVGKVEAARFRFLPQEQMLLSNHGRLLIQIRDNGQGREASRKSRARKYSQSYSMRGMEERLRWIERKYGVSAQMQVLDLYNEAGSAAGTAVVLNLPLMETPPV